MDESDMYAYMAGELGDQGMEAFLQYETPQVKTVQMSEVARHNSPKDCWVVLHGQVYDLTEFAKSHIGGSHLITNLAGTDGTEIFARAHMETILNGLDASSKLGNINFDIAPSPVKPASPKAAPGADKPSSPRGPSPSRQSP
mmetsp:Transcript_74681/g.218809  ORF Transcript_74681/g.218809 Transcript_74681/m.218809 type:complete len:142 (+) Transcript_74681:70-495(+)